jgi:hypothetical protein
LITIDHIRQRYSPEMAFVILTCRVFFKTTAAGDIETYARAQSIDWSLLRRIIRVHQVRPVVFKVLSAYPGGIDAAFLNELRKDCLRIASGNLFKLEEVLKLHTALNETGVKNIPYKGVILSHFLFDDFITRETADIDFLIEQYQFSQAQNVLNKRGYASAYQYDSKFEKQMLRSDIEMLFSRQTDAGLLKVELHWLITHRMFDIPLPLSRLFSSTQPVRIANREVIIPCIHDHALALLIHHGVNDLWRSLRHVIDIAAVVSKYGNSIDWHKMALDCRRYNVKYTSEVGFRLCADLLGIGAPSSFVVQEGNQRVMDFLLRFPPASWKKLSKDNIKLQLSLRDSFWDKLRVSSSYLKTAFVPSIRDMEAVTLPRPLYFLYYFIKPLLFAFRQR